MNLNLDNKAVVVVGGSKGIGLAIVKNFIINGAVVHIISRNINSEIEKLLADYKGYVYFYSCDARKETDLLKSREQILSTSLYLSAVIANVGDGQNNKIAINEPDVWKQNWDINFETALNTARVFSPHIDQGTLIFISSICGIEYINAPTDYSVAKSSLISFSKVLSHKLAPSVRVNVVAPGNVMIEGGSWDKKQKESPEVVARMIEEKVPLKRFGKPEEIADLVVYLASDRASFITGACIIIDGGQTVTF